MSSFRIEWKQSARRELRKLGREMIPRILEAVQELYENPHPRGSKKLIGSKHTYRIRVGEYRIVYTIRVSVLVIEIIRIGHRRAIYQKLIE